MKKIFIILLAMAATVGASAMTSNDFNGGVHGGFHRGGYYHPRTVVVGGFYSPWYYPFGFYGYPYYAYPPAPPSKLDLQIDKIRVNYSDKIKSVRLDNSLNKQEKKQMIRGFRTQQKLDILNAKKDFYKY